MSSGTNSTASLFQAEGTRPALDPEFDPQYVYGPNPSSWVQENRSDMWRVFRESHLLHNSEARKQLSKYKYDYWAMRDADSGKVCRQPLISSCQNGEEYIEFELEWRHSVIPPLLLLSEGYFPRYSDFYVRTPRSVAIGPKGGWVSENKLNSYLQGSQYLKDIDPDAIIKTYIEECDCAADRAHAEWKEDNQAIQDLDATKLSTIKSSCEANAVVLNAEIATRPSLPQAEEAWNSKLESMIEHFGPERGLAYYQEDLQRADASSKQQVPHFDCEKTHKTEARRKREKKSKKRERHLDMESTQEEGRLSVSTREEQSVVASSRSESDLDSMESSSVASSEPASKKQKVDADFELPSPRGLQQVVIADSDKSDVKQCYAGKRNNGHGGCNGQGHKHPATRSDRVWTTWAADLAAFDDFVKECCRLDQRPAPLRYQSQCRAKALQDRYKQYLSAHSAEAMHRIKQSEFGWCCEHRFCHTQISGAKTYYGVCL